MESAVRKDGPGCLRPPQPISLEHLAFMWFLEDECEPVDGERLLDPIFEPNIHTFVA
jgi:hypothetical protein